MKTKSLRKQVRDERRLARRKAAFASRLRDNDAGIFAQQRAEMNAKIRADALAEFNAPINKALAERQARQANGEDLIPGTDSKRITPWRR